MEITSQLEAGEKYFRSLVENISGAILLLDTERRVLYQNPSAQHISGYSLKEIQALDELELIHTDDRAEAIDMFERLITSPGITLPTKHRLKHKNGSYIWLESTYTNLLYGENTTVIAHSYYDITQRVVAEERAAMSNRLYEVISKINKMIIHVTNEQTLFKEACNIAVDFGKFKMAWIGTIDEEEKKLNPVTYAGEAQAYFSKMITVALDDPILSNGTIGRAIHAGVSAFCNDIANDSRMDPWAEEQLARGYQSCIALPIKRFGKVMGAYILYASVTNYFNSKEIAMLKEVSEDISFTLENFEKEKSRKRAEEELIKVYKEKEITLNRITDSVVSLDNDWRYTFLNEAALATHPFTREETIGRIIWDIHPDMKGTVFWDKYHKAMQTRTVVEIEGYYAPMGNWFFVKVYPSADGLTIFYKDITEQKKIEEQIVEEKVLLDSIIKSLPGIFYMYNKEGKFLRWNRNFETVTMYSGEEISKMHPLDFFDEDEKELLVERISDTFLYGESSVQANFLLKSKEKIPYYFTGIAIEYAGSACLIGVGIDFSERVKAQEKIKQTTKELRRLTAHLQSIREDERKRIAREIHDELGQQLTAIKMDVAWIDKKIPKETIAVKSKIKNIIELLDGSNQSIRRILSELRPNILDDYGLLEAIKWLGSQFTANTGIPVLFTTNEKEIRSSEQIAICIFRLYQEALTNITRHAEAKKVLTSINVVDDVISIIIEDDGKGFDITSVKSQKSFGILGMKERVLSLDGKLELLSSEGKGTKIIISLPNRIEE